MNLTLRVIADLIEYQPLFGRTVELQGDFLQLASDIEPEALRMPFGVLLLKDFAGRRVPPGGDMAGTAFDKSLSLIELLRPVRGLQIF